MSQFKDVVLCVRSLINDARYARVYSHTTQKNKKQRARTLRYNVRSQNGQGTAIYERFEVFRDHTDSDYVIEEYIRTK